METNQSRLLWIDRMRGIAMLAVVIQHMTAYWNNDFIYLKFLSITDIGVFFFVSGYIINKSSKIENIKSAVIFFLKKTFQLMIPFLVWGLIVNKLHINILAIEVEDIIELWRNPMLWFLLTLYGYMLLFMCFKLLRSNKTRLILYSIIVIVFMGMVWRLTGELKNATLYLPTFVFGILLSVYNKVDMLKNQLLFSFSFVVICILTPIWQHGVQSISTVVIKYLIVFGTISVLYVITTQFSWNKYFDCFIQMCGRYSIAIYCLHWPFTRMLNTPASEPYLVNNEMFGILLSVFFAIIASLICIFIKKVIEYSPLLDFVLFGNTTILKKHVLKSA